MSLPVDPDALDRGVAWASGPLPRVSVVVSTYQRASFLSALVARLLAQDLRHELFEVTIVDNGSSDDTWDVLTAAVRAHATLRMQVARVEVNRGPAGGRNLGLALSRGVEVAFTDDDCLPSTGWLSAVVAAFDGGATIVQGRTEPEGPEPPKPWDRSVWVGQRSGLFETCNIAYLRADLARLGGFDQGVPVIGHRAARPFGEDVELGWRVERQGARYQFVPEALVAHRWLPGSYRSWLAERRQLANFPALARRVPELRGMLWRGVFLSRSSASFDLGVVGVVVAVLLRNPAPLFGLIPWLLERWPESQRRMGRGRVVRLAQVALGDLVGCVALVEGSIRHRRLVL